MKITLFVSGHPELAPVSEHNCQPQLDLYVRVLSAATRDHYRLTDMRRISTSLSSVCRRPTLARFYLL